MNVLILGAGGREHALSWKISQSSILNKLFVAPGNAGTANIATNVDLLVTDFDAIANFCLANNIEMIVVGPEAPLVEGIHDYFEQHEQLNKISIIGPKKLGATLEGSKRFAKEFMMKHHIPTAKYKAFTKDTLEEGYNFLENLTAPYVLKADGLAGGKGVLILNDIDKAKEGLTEMLTQDKFGEAGNEVVIEEFLDGIELSVFVLTDGDSYKILPEAKDYKRIGEGDTGLNTGGMGAISPVKFADSLFMTKVESQIVTPTIQGFKKDGIDYKGFVFIGLMNVNGNPYVIEYNVRMGDPETEVVIPRIKSDLLDLFEGVATNTLSERDLEISDQTVCTVMAVSGGYPETYEKGKEITGLESVTESIPFHAGTKSVNEKVHTNGGRVIAVSSMGRNTKEALEKSYTSLAKISYEAMYYRKDIGFDLD